ncbi:MAG: exopolysaccharide biosynthesis protein [Rhodoferax sp.]|nr:exopolysaccharide biosynthesis protein [Rhodoferax sp.]
MTGARPALGLCFLRALVWRRRRRRQGGPPEAVTLQDLLELHGDGSLVVVLLVLSILTVTPLAGVGTVLSFAIFAISWRWACGGESRTRLPFEESLRNIALSPAWGERALRFLATLYARADRCLHPRWPGVFHSRWMPLWAAWIAVMAAIILLPLPLGNIIPSLSLVLLCLAWMFRDGVACLAALLMGAAAMAYTAAFGHLAWAMGLQLQAGVRSWLGM